MRLGATGANVFDRSVFSIGERAYCLDDVILAGMWWNHWPEFERFVVEALVCSHAANGNGSTEHDDRITDLATQFRYDRDLIAAVEMEAWLDQAGLSVNDWMESLGRRVRREAHRGDVDALVAAAPPGAAEFDAAVVPDGICSGMFRTFAVALAGRAAVSASARIEVGDGDERTAIADARCAQHAAHLDRWRITNARERLIEIGEMDAAHAAVIGAAVTPETLQARLSANHLEWLQVEVTSMTVGDEHVAREALLCCRDEGLSLEEIGSEIRVPVHRRTLLLEDAGAALQPALLSAAPGEIVGPVAVDEGLELLAVLQKTPPTLDDELVRARARAVIVSGLTNREMTNRVRWSLRF